jgi:hypothetical protein
VPNELTAINGKGGATTTMPSTLALTESLIAQVVVVAADDLNALASLHSQLHALAALPDAPAASVSAAARLEKLVERIILRDVGDANQAIVELG